MSNANVPAGSVGWKIKREQSDERLKFEVSYSESPEDFEKIAHIFQERLSMRLISQTDGPYASVFHFLFPGAPIALVFDTAYGTYFFAETKEGEPFAETLAVELEKLPHGK